MLRLLALALAPALVACASDEAPFDLEACDAPEAFRVTRVDLPINSIEARAGGSTSTATTSSTTSSAW